MDLYKRIKEGTYIIAEMSANHAGSLARAKEIIHAAKESGADCIKIQTYTPDTITIDCDNKYFQISQGTWKGENLYHLYEKAYTPWEWQGELKEEAEKTGIDFLSTPFDKTAVDFLENLKVDFYKIASFEVVDTPLIEYIASKGKPIIMSTGMASLGEIEDAVKAVHSKNNNQLVLLRCASAYPAVTDEMNLKTMVNMKETFQVPVGLSDHSEKAIGKVQYGPTTQETESTKFRRSVFCTKDIKKGEMITEENIRIIRPAYGIQPKYYSEVLGQKALCDIMRGTPLDFGMIGKENEYGR